MKPANEDSPENESLRYAILGEDSSNLTDKLKKYTGEVDWPYLKKHYESGALIYVDASLDLTEAARAIAEDDTDAVLAWNKAGDLIQPSAPHAQYWEESQPRFLALVVSPFVLIQTIES